MKIANRILLSLALLVIVIVGCGYDVADGDEAEGNNEFINVSYITENSVDYRCFVYDDGKSGGMWCERMNS